MLGFLRRRSARWRRGLGAAVTAIPSAPVGPASAPAVAVPAVAVPAVAVDARRRPGARVELGFRDGTSTALDPGSSDARALEELARTLTRGH
jgi:hypothetical protein